jgi:hypothetical protein
MKQQSRHFSADEKADMSQVCFSLSVFSFLPVDSLHSSRLGSMGTIYCRLLRLTIGVATMVNNTMMTIAGTQYRLSI